MDSYSSIERTRLKKLFISSLQKKIIIVSAIAGSGKSTFVSSVLEEVDVLYTYYSPSKNSNKQVYDFASSFLSFINSDQNGSHMREELLQSLENTDEEIVSIVKREISHSFSLPLLFEKSEDIYILIDDYHNIASQSILDNLIMYLISSSPENFHFILLSDCAINLEMFSINTIWNDQVALYSQASFMLNYDEILSYIKNKFPDITSGDASLIYELTEGYMLGVSMIISKMQKVQNYKSVLTQLRTDCIGFIRFLPELNGFFMNRVDIMLSTEQLDFLKTVALESTVHGDVISMLTDGKTVDDFFSPAEQHLYIENIDAYAQSYHINRVFQSHLYIQLKQSIDGDALKIIHQNVAVVYQEKGLYEHVLYHYLCSANILAAARTFRYLLFENVSYTASETFKNLIKISSVSFIKSDPWILLAWAHLICFQHPDIAIAYLADAMKMFRANNDIEGIMLVSYEKVLIGFLVFNKNRLLEEIIDAYENVVKDKLPVYMVLCGHYLAFVSYAYFLKGRDNDVSKEILEVADHIGVLTQNYNLRTLVLYVYIMIYGLKSEFVLLRSKIMEAVELSTFVNVQQIIKMYLYQGIATLNYVNICEYNISCYWFEKAQDIAERIDASSYLIYINFNYSYTLDCLREFEQSEMLIKQTAFVAKNVLHNQNKHLWIFALQAKAFHYMLKGDLQNAHSLINESLDACREAGRVSYLIRTLIGYSAINRELGNFDQSIQAINEATELSIKQSNVFYQSYCYFHSALIYKRMGDMVGFNKLFQESFKIAARISLYHFYYAIPYEITRIIKSAKVSEMPQPFTDQFLNKLESMYPPKINIQEIKTKKFEFFVIGPFLFKRNDEVPTVQISQKALYLLKMLIINGEPISINKILEELWENWEHSSSMNNLYMTLHQIRKYLGAKEYLIYRNGFCYIDPKLYETDLTRFHKMSSTAINNVEHGNYDTSLSFFEQACSILRGELLEGEALEKFLTIERETLNRKIIRMFTEYAKTLLRLKKYRQAIEVLSKATNYDVFEEGIVRLLMYGYYMSGDTRQALNLYQEFKLQLRKDLDVAPNQLTQNLFEKIKNGQISFGDI